MASQLTAPSAGVEVVDREGGRRVAGLGPVEPVVVPADHRRARAGPARCRSRCRRPGGSQSSTPPASATNAPTPRRTAPAPRRGAPAIARPRSCPARTLRRPGRLRCSRGGGRPRRRAPRRPAWWPTGCSSSAARAAKARASAIALSTPPLCRTSERARSHSVAVRPAGRAATRSSAPSAGLEGPQDRQRVHALDQVVAGRLAELLVGGDEVEHVVDDLEGHAVRGAERGEPVDVRRGAARRRWRRCGRRSRTATPSCPSIDE